MPVGGYDRSKFKTDPQVTGIFTPHGMELYPHFMHRAYKILARYWHLYICLRFINVL
jgi:hypothetical protein